MTFSLTCIGSSFFFFLTHNGKQSYLAEITFFLELYRLRECEARGNLAFPLISGKLCFDSACNYDGNLMLKTVKLYQIIARYRISADGQK